MKTAELNVMEDCSYLKPWEGTRKEDVSSGPFELNWSVWGKQISYSIIGIYTYIFLYIVLVLNSGFQGFLWWALKALDQFSAAFIQNACTETESKCWKK